jgi:hypothetical protein
MTSESWLRGEFWIAGSQARKTGRLTTSERWPRLEVTGFLSSPLEVLSSDPKSGVTSYGPASDFGDERFLVHGQVAGFTRRVTLMDASSSHRSGALLSGPDALNQQILTARYALLGCHADAETRFPRFRLRTSFIDDWASRQGLSATLNPSEDWARVDYKWPPDETAEVPGTGALLRVTTVWSPPEITSRGAHLNTMTWLEFEPRDGATIDEAMVGFAGPISTLLTLLHGEEAAPGSLDAWDPELNRWVLVRTPTIQGKADHARPKDDPLFSLPQLTLDGLGRWLNVARMTRPLPDLVAGTLTDNQRTVQNRLLELATAAEGLHRRLYPEARRLSEEEVREIVRALHTTPIADTQRQILAQAVRDYLWEPSFPQRLKALADDIEAACPGVTGDLNRWRRAVVDARNGFAHRPEAHRSETDLFEFHTLGQSLQWLLTARLLLAAGVEPEVCRERFAATYRYQRFLAAARKDSPRIYGQPSDSVRGANDG